MELSPVLLVRFRSCRGRTAHIRDLHQDLTWRPSLQTPNTPRIAPVGKACVRSLDWTKFAVAYFRRTQTPKSGLRIPRFRRSARYEVTFSDGSVETMTLTKLDRLLDARRVPADFGLAFTQLMTRTPGTTKLQWSIGRLGRRPTVLTASRQTPKTPTRDQGSARALARAASCPVTLATRGNDESGQGSF